MTVHVMVDLETLDVTATAVILSIGAVVFDPRTGHLGEEFHVVINTASCLDYGLTTCDATERWWQDQSIEARELLNDAEFSQVDVYEALNLFSNFLLRQGSIAEICLWGNGSDFDNAILANAYSALNLDLPWLFYNNRCYRTLKNLIELDQPTRLGTYHNALDDAKHQARHALMLLAAIDLECVSYKDCGDGPAT